ncbi:MAG: putative pilus assembly protein CpaB [Alphaproteobacteria bacterium]|jgi:pilus assembly protein CpaB|nr:putative pilus assembly protein CpaB [Alphaproteobacteria bacterium]
MRIGRVALVGVALLLAGATAYMAKTWIETERSSIRKANAPKQTANQRVLVAKTRLTTGQFIAPDNVKWVPWPSESVSTGFIVEGKRKLEDVLGSVVRLPIGVGEPMNDNRIVAPNGRGFMAAVLEPGMRAVSVSVTLTSGISGFVFPGDRVDIVLTHTYQQGEGREKKAGETILTDVRVLAIDQKTENKPGETQIAKSVTFEVTPKQSEILAVAADLGRLSLSLRSLAREDQEDPMDVAAASGDKGTPRTSFTLDSDASSLLSGAGNAKKTITVLRGKVEAAK